MRLLVIHLLQSIQLQFGAVRSYSCIDFEACDLISKITQTSHHDSDWDSLNSMIEEFSKRLEEGVTHRRGRRPAIIQSLAVVAYETLYRYLSRPDFDHRHMASLDPLVQLYWNHLVPDQVALSHARIISELIAASFAGTKSGYNDTEMEDLSYALPVKGHPEFIKYVATTVPEAYSSRSTPLISIRDGAELFEVAHRMISRISEHIKCAESRVEVASMFSSALYVYDSMVSVGDEETAGEPLRALCANESAFINELVHDLAFAHTVRQRVSLERFCLSSLSLKVRFISLFLPYIKQSYMVSPYMRGQTRIRLETHVDNMESNLVALSKLSREELLSGNIVVEYKWSVFGYARVRSIDEESWIDRLGSKLFSNQEWFDKGSIPRSDVSRPDLFVGAGKFIGLGLIRERLSVEIDHSVLRRLLTSSDDDFISDDYDESNHAMNAFIHGIFSIVPRDAFVRFFNNESELANIFNGKLYEIGEQRQV